MVELSHDNSFMYTDNENIHDQSLSKGILHLLEQDYCGNIIAGNLSFVCEYSFKIPVRL